MKKINTLSLLVALLICNLLQSQNEELFVIGKYFEFTENSDILEVEGDVAINLNLLRTGIAVSTIDKINFKTKIGISSLTSVKSGTVFKVLKKDGNLYIIKIISEDEFKDKFFGISSIELRNHATLYNGSKPKNGFVSSAITIPIKIRFGSKNNTEIPEGELERLFNFESNYNLGITAGWRNRLKKGGNYYISYLGGFNIGSTKITSETASVTEDTNTSIFTPFLGLLFEYNDFQIGVFTGWDHVGGKLSKTWVYQGKTWLGFGFGYNIFTTKDGGTN